MNLLAPKRSGFTIVEVLVLISLVMLAIALIGVFSEPVRQPRGHRLDFNALRGIHQSMFTYSAGNKDWLPGISSKGEVVAPSTRERFLILLEQEYLGGEYMISPAETDVKTPWQLDQSQPFTTDQYSYALLEIETQGLRTLQWRSELTPSLVLLSDRNSGTDTQGGIQSVHVKKPGVWKGNVLWADNHTTFEDDAEAEVAYGDYMSADDHLFESDGLDDVLMVYE